jgi:hypothetical protein
MTNKQDITVLKRSPRSYCLSMGGLKACKLLAQGVAQCRQPGPEKALKERHQQHRATPSRGRKIMVIVNSSERAISLAQGNALCRSKHIHTKPQRGVNRYISFDYALSGLNDIVRPRLGGRCPTLMIPLLQSLLHLPTTTGLRLRLVRGYPNWTPAGVELRSLTGHLRKLTYPDLTGSINLTGSIRIRIK